MPGNEIGYAVLPVIASFSGISGQVQDQLTKAFKSSGTDVGKIMCQAAGDAFAKDPSLNKAMGAAPAQMQILTSATDKQTQAVGRLDAAHKNLATTIGTPGDQSRIIATQDRHTEAIRRSENQVKQAKTSNDQLAQSIKKVNDEQKRSTEIALGGGNGSFVGGLKSDLGKALSGDTQGAVEDFGKQIGAKIGGVLRDEVKDITGMSVDAISDKVRGAAENIGVDLKGVLQKTFSGDRAGALGDLGMQLGAKAGSALQNSVKDLTGLDLGGLGVDGGTLGAGAPQAVLNWFKGGGVGSTVDWLKGGGIGNTIGSLRQGGIRGALGNLDPHSAISTINDLTGGGAQQILDMHGGITDLAEGLLGGTAAERFLPAIGDVALPAAAGIFGGQKIARLTEEIPGIKSRFEGAYDDTGTATNPLERAAESLPGIGGFFRPSDDITLANQRRRDATPGSTASLYDSVFGQGASAAYTPGAGGSGGGGGPISTEDMQVDAGVATIQAGQVILGGNVSLPSAMTSGTRGAAGNPAGSFGLSPGAGSGSSDAGSSLYTGDTGDQYFAHGGGPKGTDIVPAWLTPGEIVFDKDTSDTMRRLFGSGASYYAGGTGAAGAGGTGMGGRDVMAAHSMAGIGYSQGSRNDCSGMVGRVILRAMGLPETGLPTTQNMGPWLSSLGFKPGVGGRGAITVGWYNHGSSPNDGHAAMTLSDGENAESGGSHGNFIVGPGAAGAMNPEFDQHMFLPNLYGQGSSTGMPPSPGQGGGAGGAGGAGGIFGPGGAGGGGGALGNLLSGLGGQLGQIGGIGKQFLSDTFGIGSLFPDPTSDPLVQSGMNMLQTILGMSVQPGGLAGALTADDAGKRTFGALLGGGGDDSGSPFGMVPSVAGMPHPDDMPASPGDAAFGDVLSTRIGGGEATHIDHSQHVTVNGFSAQEVGTQVYRNIQQGGLPNNTPRMNTHVPVGG